MSDLIPYFASCLPGAEEAVCEELRELGFSSVRLNRGGIPFRGTREDGWRACLQSRTAQRIHQLLHRFPTETEEDFYDGIREIDWAIYLTPERTFSIACVCRGSHLTNNQYAGLKVKDAIADKFREIAGERPSVDRENPDVRILVYLANNKCSVYLDLSGQSLHRRGYRQRAGGAPMQETLAAVAIRYSGWDRSTPLIDPMCGSGTLAIEAALLAEGKAPGLDLEKLGFERWANFDREASDELRAVKGQLRQAARGISPKIQASDQEPDVLEAAKENARAAGVRLSFKERSVLDLQGTDQRVHIIMNPPYGRRLEMDEDFPEILAKTIAKWHGWRVTLLAGSEDYIEAIPFKPESIHPLKNGDIECDLLTYEIP